MKNIFLLFGLLLFISKLFAQKENLGVMNISKLAVNFPVALKNGGRESPKSIDKSNQFLITEIGDSSYKLYDLISLKIVLLLNQISEPQFFKDDYLIFLDQKGKFQMLDIVSQEYLNVKNIHANHLLIGCNNDLVFLNNSSGNIYRYENQKDFDLIFSFKISMDDYFEDEVDFRKMDSCFFIRGKDMVCLFGLDQNTYKQTNLNSKNKENCFFDGGCLINSEQKSPFFKESYNFELYDNSGNKKAIVNSSSIIDKDSEVKLLKNGTLLIYNPVSNICLYSFSEKNGTYSLVYNKNTDILISYSALSDGTLFIGDRDINTDRIYMVRYFKNNLIIDSVFLPKSFNDGQLNGITNIGDSVLLLETRWSDAYFYNIANKSFEMLKNATGNQNVKSLLSNDDKSIIYYNVGGLRKYRFDSKKNKNLLLAWNIKDCIYYEGDIYLYAEYDWCGPLPCDEGIFKISLCDLNYSFTTLNNWKSDDQFKKIFDFSEINEDVDSQEYFEAVIKSTKLKLKKKNNIEGFAHNGAAYFFKGIDTIRINLLDTIDGLFLDNKNYYYCNRSVLNKTTFLYKGKFVSFESVDVILNRPDKILQTIGRLFNVNNNSIVDKYNDFFKKRIKMLGVLSSSIHDIDQLPVVKYLNIIEKNSNNGIVNFRFKGTGSNHKLNRYNVYVNEVPIFGSIGMAISDNLNEIDRDISLKLNEGENKIQVTVMNDLGLESFRYPVYVQYQPAKPLVSNTYYIGIGVDSFSSAAFNLKYCVKDINDLGTLLAKDQHTKTVILKNKEVTKENVMKIKSLLQQTTEQDKVIISCSSHGLLDKNNNFYLAMHDVDFNKPEEKGLAYEDLQGLLDGIPARKKLLLLDACNSGENEKSDNNGLGNSKDLAIKQGAKGIEIESVSDSSQNKKNSFETMMELFVNVNNQTGATVISAAGGKQSAYEAVLINGKPISNGAFTYSIIEYLKQHENEKDKLTVNQLKQYTEQRVTEITNGKQKPTSRQETMEVDWGL